MAKPERLPWGTEEMKGRLLFTRQAAADARRFKLDRCVLIFLNPDLCVEMTGFPLLTP